MKIISSRHRPLRRAASPTGITIIRGRNITDVEAAEMLEALFNVYPTKLKEEPTYEMDT